MRLSGRKADAVRASTKRLPVPLTSSNERRPLRLQPNETMGGRYPGWIRWPQSGDLHLELPDLVDNFPDDYGRVNRILFAHHDWDTAPRRGAGASRATRGCSLPRDKPHRVLLSTRTRQIALVVTPPEEPPSTETDISKPALDIENLDPDAILLWTEGGHLVGTRGRGPIASRIENPLRDRSGLCKRLGTVAAWRQPSTDADTLRGHRVLHLVGEGSKPDSMPSPSQSFVSSRPAEDNAPTCH
jgi:hypothetical protein